MVCVGSCLEGSSRLGGEIGSFFSLPYFLGGQCARDSLWRDAVSRRWRRELAGRGTICFMFMVLGSFPNDRTEVTISPTKAGG